MSNNNNQKTSKEIVDEIIEVLLKNDNMNVRYGKDILRQSMDAIEEVSLVKNSNSEELKSISENIDKIANKGIDVFCTCISTNTKN